MSELLLRQTGAQKVAKVYPTLINLAPNPMALTSVPDELLLQVLTPLGLQYQRARALRELAHAILEIGSVPEERDKLMRLPHVGPYTAGAVMVFAHQKRAALPDVNVGRLGGRYFYGTVPRTKSSLFRVAEKVLSSCPRGQEPRFYYAILDFAATICTVKPQCPVCPLQKGCRYRRALRSSNRQVKRQVADVG
ncbi:MAG: hypothetical protein K6U87_03265 [Firmicutes bacterium]|nr:hypothetical protein [Bacillota bacterium]